MNRRLLLFTLLCVLCTGTQATDAQSLVTYVASDSLFPNPERGFYSHREVQAEGTALTVTELRSIRNTKGQTLILRMYYLKKFRAVDLSQAQLTLMQTDFDAMRAAGVKCILRFAYSQSETDPDAPLATILRHLDQIQPLLAAHRDVIALFQAGFIGAWGEWYYSTNNLNNTVDRRAVLNKILEVYSENGFAQIRTPNYKMAIFNTTAPLTRDEAYTALPAARTGHHNDCFLASFDDYGTYQDTSADKAYLGADTRFTPMGGETCNPSTFSTCSNAPKELARMHWTYLNADYHSYVLASWTSGGCMDEVKRRLGYRFQLVDGLYADSVRPGSGLTCTIRLVNRGWAAPFSPRPVHLLLRKVGDTTSYAVQLPEDPRFWGAGDTITVHATAGVPLSMESGRYDLLMYLPDTSPSIGDRPEYAIRLANPAVWEPSTGYNMLAHVVTVDPAAAGETYLDTLMFRKRGGTTGVTGNPELPGELLRLHGNYPNPFNGTTRIVYTVARRSTVVLRVFDMLGRQVAERIQPDRAAGRYEVPFDTGTLAAGIYLYQVRVAGMTATGRMVLVK